MSRRRSRFSWSLGPSTVTGLSSGTQDTVEAGFTGHIDPFIGKHWHNPSRWCLGKARFVGNGKNDVPFSI